MFNNPIDSLNDLSFAAVRGINKSLEAQGLPPLRKFGIDFNPDYRFIAEPDSFRFVFRFPFRFKLDTIYLTYLPSGKVVGAKLDGSLPNE